MSSDRFFFNGIGTHLGGLCASILLSVLGMVAIFKEMMLGVALGNDIGHQVQNFFTRQRIQQALRHHAKAPRQNKVLI